MGIPPGQNIQFFPVLHLLTGPPGLSRNGGIWKRLKTDLHRVMNPPRFMVQALHFSQYRLSGGAWEDWFGLGGAGQRLGAEVESTFGARRDSFVDSGGFQLLHADKIDVSRWGMSVTPEDVYALQLKYRPQRIASLDSPLPPGADRWEAARLIKISVKNAAWLAEHAAQSDDSPMPYLAVHGRSQREIGAYLRRLEGNLPTGWLAQSRFGLALGSQVPLTANPASIVGNVATLLRWMDERVPDTTPLHIFGVGDSVVGNVARRDGPARPLSYDNSTYIQKAFRLRVFDPTRHEYREYHPLVKFECPCAACEELCKFGRQFVSELMSRPAYRPAQFEGRRVNRSDILALVGLHNLFWWRMRLDQMPRKSVSFAPTTLPQPSKPSREAYSFPLAEFRARARRLLFLPCSKVRPYRNSRSHRGIVSRLEASGLREETDYDRLTLSGLYGPVHWDHETRPAIMSYDFTLSERTSAAHTRFLRFRTASVLSVIRRKYTTVVAYLRAKPYRDAFEPVMERYSAKIVSDPGELPGLLATGPSHY